MKSLKKRKKQKEMIDYILICLKKLNGPTWVTLKQS